MPVTSERPTADITEFLDRLGSGHREGHYYAALIGFRKYDPVHLASQIQRGFSYSAFERLLRNTALTPRALAHFVEIPERTLARRKEAGRLEPDESDRLARASRIFARAIELFEGNAEGARDWLTHPHRALGGRTPLEFAKTDVGAIEVENVIGRLEHGIPV